MTARRLIVSIGYGHWAVEFEDAARLFRISDNAVRVEKKGGVYVPTKDQEQMVIVAILDDVDFTQPAPAPAPAPSHGVAYNSLAWPDWLAAARAIEARDGGAEASEESFRACFDRGETPAEAVAMPF